MDKLTFVFVSDKNYIKYIKPIIKSINDNCKLDLYNIHIHLVNINQEDPIINELKNLSKFEISFSYDQIQFDPKTFIVSRSIISSEKHLYCCNIRVKVMLNLLKEKRPYLLYLDCDSIIRQELDKLFNIIKNCDITFCLENKTSGESAKSGIIGVKNTNQSLQFFEKYCHLLEKYNWRKWSIDQTCLYQLLIKHRNDKNSKLKYHKLSLDYLDWEFKNNSFIWTGKGHRKNQNIKYLKEFEKYN